MLTGEIGQGCLAVAFCVAVGKCRRLVDIQFVGTRCFSSSNQLRTTLNQLRTTLIWVTGSCFLTHHCSLLCRQDTAEYGRSLQWEVHPPQQVFVAS